MTIDYEKLKLAHGLAQKIQTHYLVHIISHKGHEYTLVDWNPDMPDMVFKDIDSLITKLQELRQNNMKYEVGQQVWLIDCDEICTAFIEDIKEDEYKLSNCISIDGQCTGLDCAYEYLLFESCEALIDAQIEYWKSLKNEEKSICSEYMSMTPPFEGEIKGFNHSVQGNDKVCEHESISIIPLIGRGFKCIKCGGLYI